MKRLLCRLFGHRWDEFLRPGTITERMPLDEFYATQFEVRCARCGAEP